MLVIRQTAEVLKALGEPTRLIIIKFLTVRELCICELTAILAMSQPRVSQHMKVLKKAGLVRERKDRQKSYFRVNNEVLNGTVIEPFRAFLQNSPELLPELSEELQRYQELDNNREVQACKAVCQVTAN
jgi:ArsR family transcriptional regulator